MKKIIALVDFSELTRDIVDFSAEQAKAFGASLYLLHVEPEAAEKLYRKIDQEERDRRAKLLRFEHQDLGMKAEELRKLGVDVKPVLLEGNEVNIILKEVDRIKPDMLVLGNHHHSSIYNFFVGSVGEQLIDEITCPLVLISQ